MNDLFSETLKDGAIVHSDLHHLGPYPIAPMLSATAAGPWVVATRVDLRFPAALAVGETVRILLTLSPHPD